VPQFAHGGYGGVHNGYAPSYTRPEANYRAYGQGFSRQSQSLNDARTAEGFNRGYPQRSEVPTRPALPSQEAYNRYPQSFGRSQQFENRQPSYESRQPAYSSRIDQYGRQSYGSAYANPSRDSYAPQRGMSYVSPSQTYRAPENSYRGNSGGRSYDSFRGGEVAQSQRSGGFHFFGSHNSSEYGGKAPKAYSYGGGRSGGGGWKAPKAPKESHFGGGHSGGGHEHSSHHR
jgi:hypothetical protein